MIEIGPFRLSPARHELSRDGTPIPLRPQAFDLLAYLAAHPGRLVTKDELLAHLWPNKVVEEAVVKVAVRELRKALADDARKPHLIETVHRCGYKLIAPVRELAADEAGVTAATESGERGARFVGLESHNHLLLESEPAWPVFLGEVRRFLGGVGHVLSE